MPDPDEEPRIPTSAAAAHLLRQVDLRVARIVRGRRSRHLHVWRAVATVGLIGWSVVLPMLAGIAVGGWIDRKWPSRFSWTLMLLVGGLILGCVSAWDRIREEEHR